MHIQHLSVAPRATDGDRHDDELVLGDEIPYAALMFGGFGARVGLDVELEGERERQKREEEELD